MSPVLARHVKGSPDQIVQKSKIPKNDGQSEVKDMWLTELLEQFAEKCTEEKARATAMPIRAVERSLKSGPVMPRIVQASEYAARLSSPDMDDREIASRFKTADNAIAKSIAARELEHRGYLETAADGRYTMMKK